MSWTSTPFFVARSLIRASVLISTSAAVIWRRRSRGCILCQWNIETPNSLQYLVKLCVIGAIIPSNCCVLIYGSCFREVSLVSSIRSPSTFSFPYGRSLGTTVYTCLIFSLQRCSIHGPRIVLYRRLQELLESSASYSTALFSSLGPQST